MQLSAPRLVAIQTKGGTTWLRVYAGRKHVFTFKSDEPVSPDDVEFARAYVPPIQPKDAA